VTAPCQWRVECQGTPKRGCGYSTVTGVPRFVIFARCPQCHRFRRTLLLEPLTEVPA